MAIKPFSNSKIVRNGGVAEIDADGAFSPIPADGKSINLVTQASTTLPIEAVSYPGSVVSDVELDQDIRHLTDVSPVGGVGSGSTNWGWWQWGTRFATGRAATQSFGYGYNWTAGGQPLVPGRGTIGVLIEGDYNPIGDLNTYHELHVLFLDADDVQYRPLTFRCNVDGSDILVGLAGHRVEVWNNDYSVISQRIITGDRIEQHLPVQVLGAGTTDPYVALSQTGVNRSWSMGIDHSDRILKLKSSADFTGFSYLDIDAATFYVSPQFNFSVGYGGGVGCFAAVFNDGSGSQLSFFGAALATKPTVSGSRGSNAALASLITALATLGLVTDSTS